MNIPMRRLTPVIMAVLGAVIAAEPILAADSDELQEIVVTARKREETLQNVPVSEDAFTEQTIKSAGIESPRDFVAMVPNMTIVEVQNVGNSFITIRGISQARNSEPSTAVLVDGVLEPNPYEFDQELFDITQIEVLKGPQGALYGRDAIGGAIIIQTADLADHFEGDGKLGVGNGVSEKAQVAVSGPVDDAGTLRYRAALNFYNTDGYLENTNLDRKADPYRDYSGRLRLVWKPNDQWTADLRAYRDRVDTTAYYYVIPRAVEANPFSSFTTAPNANDVTSPIQDQNLGSDYRDITDIALKLDYHIEPGTFTSVSDYNFTKEIDTGDAYDFRPIKDSIAYNYFFAGIPAADGGPAGESQSQFISEKTESEELRFTSNKIGGFSWIAGAYFIHTQRFISTGNLYDRGDGVPAVYETPLVDAANPYATNTNATFLADSQNNDAWAVFGDATYEFNKQWELDAAIRYDQDHRQNTTDTPQQFLPDPTAHSGEVRDATFDAAQPKGTLRYKPTDDLTFYGGWSRGFRSGGFNQTGVGYIVSHEVPPQLGVHDLFQAEIADTWEVGAKSQWFDHRLSANMALYYTKDTNGYFFFYDSTTSTQNLGNLNALYKGGELELNARATSWLDLYANYGYNYGSITAMEDPKVIGNKPPLLTQDTVNAGFQVHEPIGDGLDGLLRLDYQMLGRTWWDPYNLTSRNPVNLLDLRAGVEADRWTVTAWSKNLTNKLYNAEFSPGGFLWRAPPRRYGLDFTFKF
ncbi:MAG TPA: TonB-dependent receptor [Steroidobacteraceae bacterium]|jgi:iron complex outermembrane receptor protein|nr:TonB-dependent receptor [Steroidobacteraceae bacterium]